jgi:MFS family permease
MATTDIGMQSGASQNRNGFVYRLTHRELEHYPRIQPRSIQLAIVVISTIALYYESYVGGSVSTLLLQKLGMSFTFYVVAIAIGNLIGAFGSLVAGVADRVGRANLVVTGLLVTGLATLFLIPAMTSKWPFILSTFLVGVIEGIALVATPALIRDFSPQTGRATAMGLWTTGPVLGSLVVAVVGSATITATTQWQTEYRICGAIGLLVFLVALFGMRELSPRLRDQLMVSTKDRVLIEAKAKGIDIEASLAHPWRQMLKADIIISALAVSVMLLIYYTAVGFGTIVMTTVFGFSLRNANGIANWQWGANAVGLIVIGIISDKLRVRKPLMIFGAVGGTVLTVIFIGLLGKTVSYYEMALILATISVFLAFAYAPWMASFTETVEARNPALTATGLAIWGWTLRMVVFVSFLILPLIVTSVTPLVSYGAKVKAYANQYKEQIAFAETHASLISFAKTHASLIAFAETHPQIIATATKYQTQLANAQRFAPELSVIEHNPTSRSRRWSPASTTRGGRRSTSASGSRRSRR